MSLKCVRISSIFGNLTSSDSPVRSITISTRSFSTSLSYHLVHRVSHFVIHSECIFFRDLVLFHPLDQDFSLSYSLPAFVRVRSIRTRVPYCEWPVLKILLITIGNSGFPDRCGPLVRSRPMNSVIISPRSRLIRLFRDMYGSVYGRQSTFDCVRSCILNRIILTRLISRSKLTQGHVTLAVIQYLLFLIKRI